MDAHLIAVALSVMCAMEEQVTKPDDVTQDAWDKAHAVVDHLISMHEYAGRPAWDEPIARAIMKAGEVARENFFTMQGAAATLLKRAENAEEALAFVRRWTWEKEGNGTSEAERFSAIKHHPMIKKAGNNG